MSDSREKKEAVLFAKYLIILVLSLICVMAISHISYADTVMMAEAPSKIGGVNAGENYITDITYSGGYQSLQSYAPDIIYAYDTGSGDNAFFNYVSVDSDINSAVKDDQSNNSSGETVRSGSTESISNTEPEDDVDANGNHMHYLGEFKITYYCPCKKCNGHWGAIDGFGAPLKWGCVAVDKRVIKMHTKLIIDGYDTVFEARDTGSGVNGKHIDMFVPVSHSEALKMPQGQRLKVWEVD